MQVEDGYTRDFFELYILIIFVIVFSCYDFHALYANFS